MFDKKTSDGASVAYIKYRGRQKILVKRWPSKGRVHKNNVFKTFVHVPPISLWALKALNLSQIHTVRYGPAFRGV